MASTTNVVIPDLSAPVALDLPLALPISYDLDAFQKHAILAIHAGDNVLVTAPTGSGKTLVGEYLIAYHLARGSRVFYTTPIKSLSNQKYHDLKHRFPEATVGIMTGDIKMCPQAQIVVMTAEILRNLLLKKGTATEAVGLTAGLSLEGVAGIVMDEVHYLQDPDRGHVWEETLILCAGDPKNQMVDEPKVDEPKVDEPMPAKELPVGYQLVLLSATLASASILAAWIAKIHGRRIWLLNPTQRAVPLVQGRITSEGVVKPFLTGRREWTGAYEDWLRERKGIVDAAAAHKRAVDARRRDGYATGPPPKVRVEDPMARLLRTVGHLKAADKLPALFFLFSRRKCEEIAGAMEGAFLDTSDAAAVANIIDFHLSRYREALTGSAQYHRLRDLLCRGIAFHHSGLQPILKEIVEILFVRGYVRLLFATETFAVGLNMPTRTVVFLELEKWTDAGSRRLLRPDEYLQMAGRAGRRGIDTEGLVLYEPLRDPIDPVDLKRMLTGSLTVLESQMRFHYDFLLKMRLREGDGDDGESRSLVENSYWALEQRSAFDLLKKDLEYFEKRVSIFQVSVNAEEEAVLTEYNRLQDVIQSTVNAKQKKAKAQLVTWVEHFDSKDLPARLEQFKRLQEARSKRDEIKEQVTNWSLWNPASELAALGDFGLIGDKGTLATEVNEGHPILMSLLATASEEISLRALKAEEIPILLATFIRGEAERDGEAPSLETVCKECGPTIAKFFGWLELCRQNCITIEMSHGVHSPTDYWTLSTGWPLIVKAWQSGASLSTIAAEFGMFEGSVQRGLLRVANILEEWAVLATLQHDLETLEKLRSLDFLRSGALVTDSLYLRL